MSKANAHPARTLLMRSAAPAAFVACLALAPAAHGQAFNATPTTVQGSITRTITSGTSETITIDSNSAVIDWVMTADVSGDPLTFLPNGNTATFVGDAGAANFSVLNRVETDPSFNIGPAVFEGLVQSFLADGAGNATTTPGGFVAFYSPYGIIVGNGGRFEVPQLMLTTNDVDLLSFSNFAAGTGPLSVDGSGEGGVSMDLTSSVVGAPEDSFFIVSAPAITMDGNVYVNGSTAYVAAMAHTLTHSSGLFDIVITNGTLEQVAINHGGSTGGPSSTGAGDAHVIYGVTQTNQFNTDTTLLFSGNLGFDPAASATVVNGDIILSANYNVSGLNVDGGSVRDGAAGIFDGRSQTTALRADILLDNLDVTSNLLAISTHQVNLNAAGPSSSFTDDVLLVGREQASVFAAEGATIDIGGDLLVSARNYGQNGAVSTGEEDALGGYSSLYSNSGAVVTVNGTTTVAADGVAGFNSAFNRIGAATGGLAEVLTEGGGLVLNGGIGVTSTARTDQIAPAAQISGGQTGGQAVLQATFGGSLQITGDAFLDVSATSYSFTDPSADVGALAQAGTIDIGTTESLNTLSITGNLTAHADSFTGSGAALQFGGNEAVGGTILYDIQADDTGTVGGDVLLTANATGGSVTGGFEGGAGTGGSVTVRSFGTTTLSGSVSLIANGLGGSSDTATGGAGTGGTTMVMETQSGSLTIAGTVIQGASGVGGTGATGGAGAGGLVSLIADTDSSLTAGGATFAATGTGGAGSNGGAATGGTIEVYATTNSDLTLTGLATMDVSATAGGAGAAANGGTITIESVLGDLSSTLDFAATTLDLSASGGSINTPGNFIVNADDGDIEFTALIIQAGGDASPLSPSMLRADGSALRVLDTFSAFMIGDLQLEYANGGAIIGGSSLNNLTGTFDVFAQNSTISIIGDDPSSRQIAANSMGLASNFIVIDPNASFGANSLALQSLNTDAMAVIGGTTQGLGYTLVQSDFENIDADDLFIFLPQTFTADEFAVEVRDLSLLGSAGGGFNFFGIGTSGSLQLVGAIDMTLAGDDTLSLSANGTLYLSLPDASISILNEAGIRGGTIFLEGDRIIAAGNDIKAIIDNDATDPQIAALLLDEANALEQGAFISADAVNMRAGSLIYTQNTGAEGIYDGIRTGAGGLTVSSFPTEGGPPPPLSVIAFGLQESGGVQVTNSDFFRLINFGPSPNSAYTQESTFNQCAIATGICPDSVTTEIVDPIFNHTVTLDPVTPEQVGEPEAASDESFGFDFPGLMDAPLIGEVRLITDPVTSGGDSAVYILGGDDDEDDESEGEAN